MGSSRLLHNPQPEVRYDKVDWRKKKWLQFQLPKTMATPSALSSSFLQTALPLHRRTKQISPFHNLNQISKTSRNKKPVSFRVQSAKLPAGVCQLPFYGFFSSSQVSLIYSVYMCQRLANKKWVLKFSGRIAESAAQIQSPFSWIHKNC